MCPYYLLQAGWKEEGEKLRLRHNSTISIRITPHGQLETAFDNVIDGVQLAAHSPLRFFRVVKQRDAYDPVQCKKSSRKPVFISCQASPTNQTSSLR